MRTAIKRTLTVVLIAALSVACGIAFDRLCDRRDRKEYPRKYSEQISKNSAEFGIPVDVIYAAVKVGSNFDSSLRTGDGDDARIGLMQLTADDYRAYASKLGMNTDPGLLYEPDTNLTLGSCRISQLYGKYSDWRCVFAAMYTGTETVDEWLKDESLVSKSGRLAKIPDDATAEYVSCMESTVAKYSKLYSQINDKT